MADDILQIPEVAEALAALERREGALVAMTADVRNAIRALRGLGAAAPFVSPGPEQTGISEVVETPRLAQVQGVLRDAGRPLKAEEISAALHDRHGLPPWKAAGPTLRSLVRKQPGGPNEIVRVSPGFYTLASMLSNGVAGVVSFAMESKEGDKDTPRVRPRGRLLDALITVLEEADGALHFREAHRRMCEKIEEPRTWKAVPESMRQLVRRSKGLIVSAGPGKWTLAARVSSDGGRGDTLAM